MIFMGNSQRLVDEFKAEMKNEFEMTDLGLMKFFLGLEVKQDSSGIFISQGAYAKDILKRFGMDNCNPIAIPMELGAKLSKLEGGNAVDATEYRSLIGSLRYLTCTRSDIMFAVGVASRFMEDPRASHMKAAKRILRYVKGTEQLGLHYSKTNDFLLTGYVDSDWAGDVDDRKSTTGFVFYMGGTAFTWMSRKQPIVTMSTCEAEYVAAATSVCHAIWLRNVLHEMKLTQKEATEIRVDNKSAIELAKNPKDHGRSKYIDVRFHFIREQVKMKNIRVVHVKTQDQAADIFTKALAKPLFENCKQMLGMKDIRDLKLREDVERCNPKVSIPKSNPNSSSSEQRIPKHAKENIPKDKVRGDEMKKPKAEKPRGKMTRQMTSRKMKPKANPRLNKPVFEVGECSGTKDDFGRVIEETSEGDEPETHEMTSEHEMLRKMKRKPKSKEKCYRDKMCSGHYSKRALGKGDRKDKLQTAMTAAENKKTKL